MRASVGTLVLTVSLLASVLAAEPRPAVTFENPFGAPHALQPVSSKLSIAPERLPKGTAISLGALNRFVGLRERGGELVRVQWSDLQPPAPDGTVQATANYLFDVPARTTRVLELAGPIEGPPPELPPISVRRVPEQRLVEVRTGRLAVQLAAEGTTQPMLVKVGRSGQQPGDKLAWRGRSRFLHTAELREVTVAASSPGPVFYRQTNTYRFADGVTYRIAVTCWAGLDYLTADEAISGPANERMRWLFDLEDWPTHVYTAGHGPTHKFVSSYRHSGTYLDFPLADIKPSEEIVWLPNYLIWSRFEDALLACFARSAAGPGGAPPFDPDLLMLFQIRRGEWEDELWAKESQRPLGDAPWQPWSQRRWWGSRYSTIRVARNGHERSGALMNFSLTPGTRSWGLWAGDSSTLPPPRQKLDAAPLPSLIKTAAGETRLNELQHRVLNWPPDPRVEHPRIELTPALLRDAEQRAATDPVLAAAWSAIRQDGAVRALLAKDKPAAAAIARGVLDDLHSRFNFPTTDGIEFSSHLSPVGIRPVFRHASTIDVLLGEPGLLDADTQRQLRERFAYLAYLLADSSFMAHRYNAGHPNFDADRYVALAGIAMLYPDHPHARQWLDLAVGSFREAMRVYVIPQSGKWAENLGGYYNWSTNLLGGLARSLRLTGSADPFAWPEFQNFWRWGLVTALPPKPSVDEIGSQPSANLRRIRQTPGIGDNGGDGGLGVHGGFAIAGAGLLPHQPELGRQLLWLWDHGGRQNYDHYPYALFFGLDAESLRRARDPQSSPEHSAHAASPARSQILDGYGSLFRSDFGRPTESYLLFKAGPGGYRYHGEEGSFVLFGLGQPLTLDGANNFRPEQHSTVTFGPDRTGVERGRIVQFETTADLDYAFGRFPETQAGSDVLTRQLLFRKNDYVVLRDHLRSSQPAHWHLLLLTDEPRRSPGRVTARGLLGVDVTVWLFRVAAGSQQFEPLPVDAMTLDTQPLKQQRLTVSLAPGVGLVAVLDFHDASQRPWEVTAQDGELRLDLPGGNTRERIRLTDAPPAGAAAQWERFERGQRSSGWQSRDERDPWK